MYAEVRRTPCNVHVERIMTGLHCVTLQTVKQRFVSNSKAALPSVGESLNVYESKIFINLIIICLPTAYKSSCPLIGDNHFNLIKKTKSNFYK